MQRRSNTETNIGHNARNIRIITQTGEYLVLTESSWLNKEHHKSD